MHPITHKSQLCLGRLWVKEKTPKPQHNGTTRDLKGEQRAVSGRLFTMSWLLGVSTECAERRMNYVYSDFSTPKDQRAQNGHRETETVTE